jgi:hypothetical protein
MRKVARSKRNRNGTRGSALLVSLMVIVGLSLLGLGFVAISETESAIAKNQQTALQTQAVAEAGAKTIVEWIQDPTWGNTNAALPANDATNLNLAAIKITRTISGYSGVYKPSATTRLLDKPYRANNGDKLFGDEDHADLVINRTTDPTTIDNFNTILLGPNVSDRSGGEVSEIKIFAPPIVGGVLTNGFWAGGTRYGLATIKVTAQQYRDPAGLNAYKLNAANVMASHAVRLVVGEIPLPIPGGPIQSNTAISFGGDFVVHWGNETSTGTLQNKRNPTSVPWANAFERPHYEHGYEPGTSIASVGVISTGTGYDATTTVTIDPPTAGTTATATPTISGGKVTAITMTARGSGYVAAPPNWGPVVTITGPAGSSGAAGQAYVGAEAWPITGGQFDDAKYFYELIDKDYEDPWFGSRAVGDNLADGAGPPSPLNAQCFPYSYSNTENSAANPSYFFQWQSTNAFPWQRTVIFPAINYDFWKKISSQSRGYKGIYYFAWDSATGGFKRSNSGTAQPMYNWVDTTSNGLGAGLYFFDTRDGSNPQLLTGGAKTAVLTPPEGWNAKAFGNTFLMVGFVYMNTQTFGTTGVGNTPTTVQANFPGEPYRDIGYPKWDNVANNWDLSCGGSICRAGAGDGIFSYQEMNGNGKFDVVTMPSPAFNSYDPGATGHPAGATYVVKTWKSNAQAMADYGAVCTVPGTNPATDCSEPHEPYLNMIYPAAATANIVVGWEQTGMETRRAKAKGITCVAASSPDDCTSNGLDVDGAMVPIDVILDGVLYNEGDYDSQGNCAYYGSLLIQGTVGGTGTPDIWFDEKLLKGTWAPPGMPRVMVFSEQTDEISQ